MITLRHLTIFRAVAECKRMSEAARQLYISQPTVSQTISEIEVEYDVLLFERSPKELRITPAGGTFLEYASLVLDKLDSLDHAMRGSAFKLPMRVGATVTVGNTLLSSLLAELKQANPLIDLYVTVDNTSVIEQMLLHNELDIALVEGMISRDEITTEPVIQDTMVLICGRKHPFAERSFVSLEELRGEDFILRERGSGTRAMFVNLAAEHLIPINIKWECCSGTAIREAVIHNHGLSFLSYRCVRDDCRAGLLHAVKLENCRLNRSFYLAYHKNKTITPQMDDFIKIIKHSQDDCGISQIDAEAPEI